MNKEEFVSLMAKKHNITKLEAQKSTDYFCSTVTEALSNGGEVGLIGFGKFSVNSIPERKGRNPKTGAPMLIKAYRQPKFSAGKKLKESCNR